MIRRVINSGSAGNCRVYKNQMIKTDCIFKHRHTVNTSAHMYKVEEKYHGSLAYY
jgi:hypothetical protein